jgi:hypothetical protein|tara:strand:+ start:232 stop:474 length:243 start_codon:yes stop_codon:yes gene_type:complete
MVEYKILKEEKPQKRLNRKWNLPLDKLKKGYTLHLPMDNNQARDQIGSVRTAVYRYKQKHPNFKFSTQLREDGIAIIRQR